LLLIASNKTDLATDYLILRLHERSVPFIRINTEDYLLSWEMHFSLEGDRREVVISKKGRAPFSVETIHGAYIRQPKMPALNVTQDDQSFAEREVGESLKSLWRAIDENVWLNAPHRILRASNKPEQLAVSQSIGFKIPDTYIGTNHAQIRSFYKKCSGNMIAKAVKHGFSFEGGHARVAATQKIDQHSLESIQSYAALPMIFQKQIDKQYDIRVTVVANKVFSIAIESQQFSETKVDWRLADSYKISLRQYAINLPEPLSALCVSITRHFRLKYAAIDLVLAKDGTYYFLELNPNGQWAWIEQLGLHKIRDAIIDELAEA
jgi:glutathione synthase/RimK-type ligase-like ATP-grasp enzyme